MIENFNPYELNILANIEKRTIDKSSGQVVETWGVEYANVWMKRLSPPRGTETQQANQTVGVQRDSFLLRDEYRDPMITAADFRIVFERRNYYVTGKRPFKSSLNFIVLDTERRDNEGLGSETGVSLDTILESELVG